MSFALNGNYFSIRHAIPYATTVTSTQVKENRQWSQIMLLIFLVTRYYSHLLFKANTSSKFLNWSVLVAYGWTLMLWKCFLKCKRHAGCSIKSCKTSYSCIDYIYMYNIKVKNYYHRPNFFGHILVIQLINYNCNRRA